MGHMDKNGIWTEREQVAAKMDLVLMRVVDGQDVCVNRKLIRASQIAPQTILKATRNNDIRFKSGDCIFVSVS